MDDKQQDILPPTRKEADEMWENILSNIRIREKEKKRNRIIRYSIAASVAILLMVGGTFSYNEYVRPDIYISDGTTIQIALADGSKVTLFRGAKLTVEKSFPADTRDVFLKGDAVFHVTKSKKHPFIVHGQGYETKVLGTVFKVSQSGKTFIVDLFEGKVLVYRKGHSKEPIALKPQQTFSNLGIPQVSSVTKTVDNSKSASIKEKSAAFTFDKCPISDAVKVIERKYGITIHYPADLKNDKITIRLPNATAEAFIQSLAIQFNLHIKQNNDSIFELEK